MIHCLTCSCLKLNGMSNSSEHHDAMYRCHVGRRTETSGTTWAVVAWNLRDGKEVYKLSGHTAFRIQIRPYIHFQPKLTERTKPTPRTKLAIVPSSTRSSYYNSQLYTHPSTCISNSLPLPSFSSQSLQLSTTSTPAQPTQMSPMTMEWN